MPNDERCEPIPPDQFSEYYDDVIDETYDCADRIVISAYYPQAQSGGGFRDWWRRLMGTDDNLDDARLQRFAGRFARRVRAFCKASGIPIIMAKPGQRKHELVEPHIPTDPQLRGVFCVVVGRAKASVMRVERRDGRIVNIFKKHPMPFVNLYHFHIMDPEWGHVIIRFCPHPPFSALIILNGHEFVAREADNRGIDFSKEGNCFTSLSDAAGLATIAETLSLPGSEGRLVQVCERWIYTACLSFAVSLEDQTRTWFRYGYSVCQMEFSRNLLFTRGRVMETLFDEIICRTWKLLDISRLKKIFGYKYRPYWRDKQGKVPKCEVEVVRPTWDLTVFKVHLGNLTVKIYTKGARVLRIEAIAHRAEELRCGKRIDKFPQIYAALRDVVYHFLSIIRSVDAPSIDLDTLDSLPLPSTLGATRVGGLDISKPRIRAIIEALIPLSLKQEGFVLGDLVAKVSEVLSDTPIQLSPAQVAYDLKKIRAKQIVRKIPNSHRYQILLPGLRVLVAILVLQDKVIRPVIGRIGKRSYHREPSDYSEIDRHYERIQLDMQALFSTLQLAS